MTKQFEKIHSIELLVQRAQAFAEVTRMRILLLLLEGEATVSDIVTRLGVPQPSVSTHLAFLLQAGLLSVTRLGRQRRYHPDTTRITAVLDALQALTPTTPRRSPQAARQVKGNTAIRQARTCYDHLAGVAGVQLLEAMLRRAWLQPDAQGEPARPLYLLTQQGTEALKARGVNVDDARKARRRLAFGCVDWTERCTHLGGSLGAAILDTMVAAGIIQRQRQCRSVILQKSVVDWLDTAPPENPVEIVQKTSKILS